MIASLGPKRLWPYDLDLSPAKTRNFVYLQAMVGSRYSIHISAPASRISSHIDLAFIFGLMTGCVVSVSPSPRFLLSLHCLDRNSFCSIGTKQDLMMAIGFLTCVGDLVEGFRTWEKDWC